jgi:hypothetical protein
MLSIDPLHLTIALGPLATYLLVLGGVHLSRRPLVTSGARDGASLALAVTGLVIVGPMELFLVEEAAAFYGIWIWAMMLAAWWLLASLVILLMRPRLVIYNSSLDQLRPVLATAVSRLDAEARWAGDSILLPQLDVQLYVEAQPMMQTVQLVAVGTQQSLAGWQRLEAEIVAGLRKTHSPPSMLGAVAIGLSLLLAATITLALARDPGGTVQALNEMLRR